MTFPQLLKHCHKILRADIIIQEVSPVFKSNVQTELIHSIKANLAFLKVFQCKLSMPLNIEQKNSHN